MAHRQPFNYKSNQFGRQKQDPTAKYGNDEMEETEVSITDSSFAQKTPITSRKEVPSSSIMNTPVNSSHTSPIDTFKKLLSPSNILLVNGIKYIKIGQIGSGRYSTVHKVLDPDGNIFALKIVKCSNTKAREMYLNEISFLNNNIDSDRIIRLIDYEVTDKEIYLICEHGDTDLRQFIDDSIVTKQNKQLSPNYLRYLWQQMLFCVQELHSKNAIHGNLRPENFLFVKGSLKLIDFGIVKVIQDDQTSIEDFGIQLSRRNDYRSPEVISERTVKWRTSADVWSLGCMLYELAYGKYPYPSENYRINYNKISYPKIPNFPDMKNLQLVLSGCLNKDERCRPTIDDLLAHPFIQPFSIKTIFDLFEQNQDLAIEKASQNLKNLAKQVHDEFNDNEFGEQQGLVVRLNLAKDFIEGKPMRINAKSK